MTSQGGAKARKIEKESGSGGGDCMKEGAQIVATHGAIVNYGSTRSNGNGKQKKKKEGKHEGSDESGKNIVFDNQTENVHSLSQNKANKMPATTTKVAKGAEKAGKNTNTHTCVCVCVVGLLNSRICVQFLAICHPPPHASLPPHNAVAVQAGPIIKLHRATHTTRHSWLCVCVCLCVRSAC